MKNTVIFIDTRYGEEYVDIIIDHMKYLKGWSLHICSNKKGVEFYSKYFFATFHIIEDINHQNDYNLLLTHPLFWIPFLKYEHVLFIQHDSLIFNKEIDKFLEYDYVGAPWTFQDHGGNGGLSLRDPNCMHDICNDHPYNFSLGNEDLYFCNYMFEHGYGKLAPRSVCEEFSMEVILKYDTFGAHAIDKYHDEDTCKKIKEQAQ